MRKKSFQYRLAQSIPHVIYDCSSRNTTVNRQYSLVLPFRSITKPIEPSERDGEWGTLQVQIHITCMKL
jgi:hypothetical protein